MFSGVFNHLDWFLLPMSGGFFLYLKIFICIKNNKIESKGYFGTDIAKR